MGEILPQTAEKVRRDLLTPSPKSDLGLSASSWQSGGGPSRVEVLEALERICRAEPFRNSERLARFLSYVVTETLEGRADRIKSYSIGLEVFNKTNEFDGGNDSIVRSAANRLRSALDDYYRARGADDPVVIELPKGRYVPLFSWRKQPHAAVEALAGIAAPLPEDAPAQARWPASLRCEGKLCRTVTAFALVGLTFCIFAASAYLRIVYETVVLTAPPTVIIDTVSVSPQTPETEAIRDYLVPRLIGAMSSTGFARVIDATMGKQGRGGVYTGSATTDETTFLLRLVVQPSGRKTDLLWQLVENNSNVILWSATEVIDTQAGLDMTAGSLAFKTWDDAANALAFNILGTDGAVPALLARFDVIGRESGSCLSTAQRLTFFFEDADLPRLRRCLENLTSAYPRYVGAWALLGHVYYRLGTEKASYGGDKRELFELADEAVAKARRLAPDTFIVRYAQMFSAFYNHRCDEFERLGNALVTENNGDPNLKIRVGNGLTLMGRREQGAKLIDEGILAKQAEFGPDFLIPAFDSYLAGRYGKAIELCDKINLDDVYVVQIIRAVSYARLGKRDEAARSLSILAQLRPQYERDFYYDFRTRNISEDAIFAIADGLRLAGMNIALPKE